LYGGDDLLCVTFLLKCEIERSFQESLACVLIFDNMNSNVDYTLQDRSYCCRQNFKCCVNLLLL